MEREKVILRFLDKRIIKGYLDEFSPSQRSVSIEDESSKRHNVDTEELKAIFFVRSFEGDKRYKEKKSFRGTQQTGKRVFVRFKDGEAMIGYIEGDIPWKKGFFLEAEKKTGFFLRPVDGASNNMKVFVIATSIDDVTVVG
ncbi:MAG TPA: hypothetical protein DCP92_16945 [Nitrospiraceae bacterium]|jgi:hypothetical protein|nr:hypothetical protein [Nitrospiraceae bacterium]